MNDPRVGVEHAMYVTEEWDLPNQAYYNESRVLPSQGISRHTDPDCLWDKVLEGNEYDHMRVVDIGGSFGMHYHGLKEHYGEQLPVLEWDIIECQPLVSEGWSSCKELDIEYYRDVDELECPGTIDVLHMSAVIFTMHMDELRNIFKICNNAKYILILNTPLTIDVPTQYAILPPAGDPGFYCIHNLGDLNRAMTAEGYECLYAFGRADLMVNLGELGDTIPEIKRGMLAHNVLMRKAI